MAAPPTPARWDHRKYGSREDPVRQSDLNEIASGYGCPARFAYRKRAEAAGTTTERPTIAASKACGTAAHEMIARAMRNETARVAILRDGHLPPVERLRIVFDEELARAAIDRATKKTLLVEWYGDSPQEAREDLVHMVRGVLGELAARAVDVVACEAPFLVQLGDYWMSGTIDLAYRPKADPTALGLADWKTGANRLAQVLLDHGYQTGVYAHALDAGAFWPDTPDERRVGEFPAEIHVVHLRDYLPYSKRTTKTIDRPEEVAFFGHPRGTTIAVVPAEPVVKMKKDGTPYKKRETANNYPEVLLEDRRGPAWYRAKRERADVAELAHDLRHVVRLVRLGLAPKSKDEHCAWCPFRDQCLGDGYAPAGDDARQLDASMRGLDLGDTDDLSV